MVDSSSAAIRRMTDGSVCDWFELPLHLTDCCVLYPFEAGQRACPGPMQQVAMRRQEP